MKERGEMKNCYGKYSAGTADCRKCEYGESCCFYKKSAGSVNCHLGMVSFDNNVAEWLVADEENIPGCEKYTDPKEEIMHDLAYMLRWLLSLDDYTLEIVSQLVSGNGASVALMAERRGCSRQAIHEKMLHAVTRYPELATLFQTALRKVGGVKSRFCRYARRNGTV